MKKYEYKFVMNKNKLGFAFDKKCKEIEIEWNNLGELGWKFCSWGNGVAIFIREIDE